MSEIRTYYIKVFASVNGYTGDDLAAHLENGPLYTDESGVAVDVTNEIAALRAALARETKALAEAGVREEQLHAVNERLALECVDAEDDRGDLAAMYQATADSLARATEAHAAQTARAFKAESELAREVARREGAERDTATLNDGLLDALRERNLASYERDRLRGLVEQGAKHLLAMSDGAHNCAGCGLLHKEWLAALAVSSRPLPPDAGGGDRG